MVELLFEKEYELLQEIGYPHNGAERKTKSVILKAPTFKQSEKIEAALRQLDPITSIINFICEAKLITTKENDFALTSALLYGLHIKAYRALANDYCKFFLTSELTEEEKLIS